MSNIGFTAIVVFSQSIDIAEHLEVSKCQVRSTYFLVAYKDLWRPCNLISIKEAGGPIAWSSLQSKLWNKCSDPTSCLGFTSVKNGHEVKMMVMLICLKMGECELWMLYLSILKQKICIFHEASWNLQMPVLIADPRLYSYWSPFDTDFGLDMHSGLRCKREASSSRASLLVISVAGPFAG